VVKHFLNHANVLVEAKDTRKLSVNAVPCACVEYGKSTMEDMQEDNLTGELNEE